MIKSAHATAKIQNYNTILWVTSGILTARLYETRRKVSQECSHSFRLALSRPNSDVKAHKYFTSGKVGTFHNKENYSWHRHYENQKKDSTFTLVNNVMYKCVYSILYNNFASNLVQHSSRLASFTCFLSSHTLWVV